MRLISLLPPLDISLMLMGHIFISVMGQEFSPISCCGTFQLTSQLTANVIHVDQYLNKHWKLWECTCGSRAYHLSKSMARKAEVTLEHSEHRISVECLNIFDTICRGSEDSLGICRGLHPSDLSTNYYIVAACFTYPFRVSTEGGVVEWNIE